MTGTVTPPRPATGLPPRPAGRPPGGTARPAPPRWRDDATFSSTIALTLLTLSVAVGFGRLFNSAGFLGPVVLATLAGHGVAWWCRRNDLPTGASAVASLGAVGLIAAWTVLGHTTAYGVPLPLTVRVGLDALGSARDLFATVRAPAAVLPGFVLATVLAIGISAFMADWAAFRLQATFEALIPAFTLFLFTAALGTPRHRSWALGLFVAAVLAFLVVQQLSRSNRRGAWFGGRAGRGPGTIVKTAVGLGAVALLAGLVIGPRLPAPDGPLIKYKNRVAAGPSSRVTISPLVDIRGRIVEQRDVEVFTVKAAQPSYWRLTSLDTFDGSIWSSNSTYRDVRGRIRSDEILQPTLDTMPLDQEFSISGLSSIWLPAAFRPQRATGVGVSYAADSSSLITPQDTSDGDTYTVRSAIPKMTPDLLNRAPAQVPPSIAARYLALPAIPPRVRAEAQRITANATTPYQRALALQNHFKNNYRYDINAGRGHDERSLETFLFQAKAGYCEQFAGTYAVLARLVGLPARVAVGFTPGVLDDKDGLFHVKGGHGHAWAEVYLHGYGWVQFDPTPGRADPQASAYTGLAPAQDETLRDDPDVTTPTTVAGGQDGAETPTTDPIFPEGDQGPVGAPTPDRGRPAIVTLLLGLAAAALLWSAVVALLHLVRRIQRWRLDAGASAAAGPDAAEPAVESAWQRLLQAAQGLSGPAETRRRGRHVLAAWADLEETFDRAGVRRRAAETMFEFSRRVGPSAGLQAESSSALRSVAQRAAVAAYAEEQLDPEAVTQAVRDARLVRDAVLGQLTWWARLRWWIDPRPLFNRPRPA